MGDRALLQVVTNNGAEFGPVLYLHWSGSVVPGICERLKARMATRLGDLSYSSARMVQEAIGDDSDNLSFGISNADAVLTAEDSPGDAGVILIHCDKGHAWEPLCGYHRDEWLKANPNGIA